MKEKLSKWAGVREINNEICVQAIFRDKGYFKTKMLLSFGNQLKSVKLGSSEMLGVCYLRVLRSIRGHPDA